MCTRSLPRRTPDTLVSLVLSQLNESTVPFSVSSSVLLSKKFRFIVPLATSHICLSCGRIHRGAAFALEAVSLPHCQLLCFQCADGIVVPLCDAQLPGPLLSALSLLLTLVNARCYDNSNQLLLLLFLSCFRFDELLLVQM